MLFRSLRAWPDIPENYRDVLSDVRRLGRHFLENYSDVLRVQIDFLENYSDVLRD